MVFCNYIIIELMEDNNEDDCFIYAIIYVSNCSNISEKSASFSTYGKLISGIITFDGNTNFTIFILVKILCFKIQN
jgi:hypothetical protein